MKYMLLMYGTEGCYTAEERTACMVESMGVCDELAARGQFLDASPLESVTTAVTVRVRGGQTLITEGPFAETTEQLGGYYVLDLPDLDAAIAVASRLPPVRKGTVEIRPLVDTRRAAAGPAGLRRRRPDRPVPAPLLRRRGGVAGGRPGRAWGRRWRRPRPTAGGSDEAGAYLSAAPLHPAATATCVRVRDGKRTITDGPFAETHEVLGGYFLFLAASRDEAVRVAARHPGARLGSVEVRPTFDLSELRDSLAISGPAVDPAAARSTRG